VSPGRVFRAVSSAGEHCAYNAGVGGSNPSPPTANPQVAGLLFVSMRNDIVARPRTGRGSGRFRVCSWRACGPITVHDVQGSQGRAPPRLRPRAGRASRRFRPEPQLLHTSGDIAVPVGKQMTIGAKGHAQVGVAELSLHHERVRALGDHQRHAGMSQRVGGDLHEASFSRRRFPEPTHEVSVVEDVAARRREHEFALRSGPEMLLQEIRDERGIDSARLLRGVLSCSL
jgi:hypothetical protein